MSRSIAERLLQGAIRASGMRNRMLAPARLAQFAAAPRAPFDGAPPQRFDRRLEVERRVVDGWPVYAVRPVDRPAPAGTVVYLHGGAYVLPFSPATHWAVLERISLATGRLVFAPVYPLAPEHSWRDVFPALVEVHQHLLADRPEGPLAVMGDSAGGGMALALCHALAVQGLPQPQHVVLLSPWLDLSMSNPAIAAIARRDPVLNPEHLLHAARAYAAGEPLTNPLLSPLHVDLTAITARITVFTGTYDVLNPDARRLRDRASREGIEIGWFEREGAMHTWMLAGPRALDQVVTDVRTELEGRAGPEEEAPPA